MAPLTPGTPMPSGMVAVQPESLAGYTQHVVRTPQAVELIGKLIPKWNPRDGRGTKHTQWLAGVKQATKRLALVSIMGMPPPTEAQVVSQLGLQNHSKDTRFIQEGKFPNTLR